MRPLSGPFTPWAENALAVAGLTRKELADLTPDGWDLHGFARSARGPWTFALVSTAPNVVPMKREATAHRISDVREAIAGLLASVTPDLELQLRASLAVLEGKRA